MPGIGRSSDGTGLHIYVRQLFIVWAKKLPKEPETGGKPALVCPNQKL